jgi:hypothetical protein
VRLIDGPSRKLARFRIRPTRIALNPLAAGATGTLPMSHVWNEFSNGGGLVNFEVQPVRGLP